MLPETLLLWDIDKTLLTTAGVSREVYALAFEALTGRISRVTAVTAGRTEYQIMKDLFLRNAIGVDVLDSAPDLDGVLAESLNRKTAELARRGAALPGARRLLKELAEVPAVVQSVLTGNVRANAATKLATFGLDPWLDLSVGAYGSDGRARWELVGLARERARRKYGITFDAESTILVGDTPRDVEAARVGGAKVIGVATGASSVDALSDAGADRAVENLADAEGFLAALVDLRLR